MSHVPRHLLILDTGPREGKGKGRRASEEEVDGGIFSWRKTARSYFASFYDSHGDGSLHLLVP